MHHPPCPLGWDRQEVITNNTPPWPPQHAAPTQNNKALSVTVCTPMSIGFFNFFTQVLPILHMRPANAGGKKGVSGLLLFFVSKTAPRRYAMVVMTPALCDTYMYWSVYTFKAMIYEHFGHLLELPASWRGNKKGPNHRWMILSLGTTSIIHIPRFVYPM